MLVAVVVGISVRVLAGEVLAVVVAVDPETDVSRTVVSPETLPDALGAKCLYRRRGRVISSAWAER